MGVDIAVFMDTTGSQRMVLNVMKQNVGSFIDNLFNNVPELRMSIGTHGDFCDAHDPHVVSYMDFTTDRDALCDFIRTDQHTNGCGSYAAYELVLREARSLAWQAGNSKVLLMIGDALPNEEYYYTDRSNAKNAHVRIRDPRNNRNNISWTDRVKNEQVAYIDWKNELNLLVEAGIKVYGVHCMPGMRGYSKQFWQDISSLSDGIYLTLDQFTEVEDIILAVAMRQVSPSRLDDHQSHVQGSGRMNRNMSSVFTNLGSRNVTQHVMRAGLIPVPSGRFQVMNVSSDIRIDALVNNRGIIYNKGRGFYEFTKAEIIQSNKEVVVMDNSSGDFFTSVDGTTRDMIGIGSSQTSGKVRPLVPHGYTSFIQSNSYTRILKGGTRFLYEVND